MDNKRLSQKIEAEYRFTQTLMILDYENTGKILQTVNQLYLSGKSIEDILEALSVNKP